MASPVDAGRATTSVSTGADPWTVNLPGSIASGDLIVIWLCNQGAANFNLPSGYSWLLQNRAQPTSGDVLSIIYKRSAGGEAGTLSVDLTAAVKGAAIAWRITGAADPATQAPELSSAHDTTGSNSANPPSISPTGGSKDYLFLVLGEMDGENATGFSHSVYVNDQTPNSGTAGAAGTNLWIGGASRQATTATEDPATWTHGLANSGVTAYTVAIHPAGAQAYTLDCQPGSYSVTGAAATLARGLFMSADPGSYAVTGFATTLARGFTINAVPGSYAVTGSAATTVATRVLSADPGAYTVSGAAVTLARGLFLSADPGSYAVSGAAASIVAGRAIAADPGSYALTGADATLVYVPATTAYELDAQPGSYAVSGSDATLARGLFLNAQPGVYAVSGADAALLAGRMIIAAPGEYTLSGVTANLVFSGAPASAARQRTLTGMGT